MDIAARRFARRILLLHLVLLGIVLAAVTLAVRYLHHSAREQAKDQQRQTQDLLTRQTAVGIESYYRSITSVLDLLKPLQMEGSTPMREIRRSPAAAARASAMRIELLNALWNSMRDRVSLVFIVDPGEMAVVDLLDGTDDASAERNFRYAQNILAEKSLWLRNVHEPAISSFSQFEKGAGHLVCVPLRGSGYQRLLVAFVPIQQLERSLLSDVNSRENMGAMLVDTSGTVISSSRSELVGMNVLQDFADPRTTQLAKQYMELKTGGHIIFDEAETMGGVELKPAISTIQPMSVLNERWWLVVSADLSRVDEVVTPIFREVMIWAGFLMVAVTAILVSTAVQLIRGRMRLERMHHEMLNKELMQAREIQLNWLPDQQVANRRIDIAAINKPASHVSGDFYNWFDLPDGRLVVTIGDVTGHGMAAAFLMATTQLLIRNTMTRIADPGQCLEEVNRQLCVQVFNGQFVTMQIVVIDVEQGTLDIATAGHPAPFVGYGQQFKPLEIEPQLVLGVDDGIRFETQHFSIGSGASVLLYTDGVIDAQSASGTRYNIEGLAQSLYGKYDSAQAIIDAVVEAVDEFRAGRELADDLTLVAIQLAGVPSRAEQQPELVTAK